jgi:protein involved in ribonucleotide reduction
VLYEVDEPFVVIVPTDDDGNPTGNAPIYDFPSEVN